MEFGYITFRSVTLAQRGERVLAAGGIPAALQRTPRWMEERGCGYCLRLRQKSLTEAAELLRKNGVPYRKLYIHGSQGILEEAGL